MPETVLVLTVGTGNATDVERSILSPFRRSLGTGDWGRIVLLPSQATIRLAETVRAAHASLAERIEIRPLPAPGDEYNLDQSFAHFQQVLFRMLEDGTDPNKVTIDLTRGTKAMSAALALAAVSAGIHSIRYIEGSAKDASGMTIAGTENVTDINALTVSRSRTLSLAENFLRQGLFPAAASLITADPGMLSDPLYAEQAGWIHWAASFWGNWDAFDYPAAEQCLSRLAGQPAVPRPLHGYLPDEDQCRLLSCLGLDSPTDPKAHLPLCRALAADLLANARRRLAQGQTEETLVRIARVLELIGQIRLFTHGLDSSDVPANDPRVAEWKRLQEKKGRKYFDERDGKLILPRHLVGSLLKHLKDPLAPKLNKFDWLTGFDAELRNHSVLIHGFTARSRGLAGRIAQWLSSVERFYAGEHPDNCHLLAAARFRFFPGA